MTEKTYKIVRYFFDGEAEEIKTGLTRDEAESHCQDPETSSKTAKSKLLRHGTEVVGPWFDGFQEDS